MQVKTLDDFNREYLAVHVKKEDLFWSTYMGIEPDPHALQAAETEFKAYISDPNRFKEVREALAVSHMSEVERQGLEGELFRKRAKVRLTYRDSEGKEHEGSTNVMATHISTSRDEKVRKTAHEALLYLGQWVLNHGFIPLVRKRNEFARALGCKTERRTYISVLTRSKDNQIWNLFGHDFIGHVGFENTVSTGSRHLTRSSEARSENQFRKPRIWNSRTG